MSPSSLSDSHLSHHFFDGRRNISKFPYHQHFVEGNVVISYIASHLSPGHYSSKVSWNDLKVKTRTAAAS